MVHLLIHCRILKLTIDGTFCSATPLGLHNTFLSLKKQRKHLTDQNVIRWYNFWTHCVYTAAKPPTPLCFCVQLSEYVGQVYHLNGVGWGHPGICRFKLLVQQILVRMAFFLPRSPHLFHLVNLAGPGDVGRATPEDTLHRRHRALSFQHSTGPTFLFRPSKTLPVTANSSLFFRLPEITHDQVFPHTSSAQKLAMVILQLYKNNRKTFLHYF